MLKLHIGFHLPTPRLGEELEGKWNNSNNFPNSFIDRKNQTRTNVVGVLRYHWQKPSVAERLWLLQPRPTSSWWRSISSRANHILSDLKSDFKK